MSSVVLIRAIVWCSPQFGHCETSSKRCRQYTQRKRARKLRGPQPGLAATGAFGSFQHVNHPCSTGRRRNRWCRRGRAGAGGSAGRGTKRDPAPGRRDRRPRVAAPRRLPPDRAGPRSAPRPRGARSCRSSRRACRPGRSASRPRSRIRPCSSARRSIARGDLRQRASGREASAPRSEQGGSTSTRSKPDAIPPAAASASTTVTLRRPRRLCLLRDFRRPGGVPLDRDHLAAVAHPGGDLAGLDPGPGAEVEHVLARLGVEHLDHRRRAAALRGQLARRDQLRHGGAGATGDHDLLGRSQRPRPLRPAGRRARPRAGSPASPRDRGAAC